MELLPPAPGIGKQENTNEKEEIKWGKGTESRDLGPAVCHTVASGLVHSLPAFHRPL